MSYAHKHGDLESGDTVNTVQGQQQLSEVIYLWMQLCTCLLGSFCGCVCVCVCARVFVCVYVCVCLHEGPKVTSPVPRTS